MKRWILLENNPALLQPGWLPPEGVCPELAAFRAEHERLLAAVRAESAAAHEIRKRHELEEAERADRLTAAFLTNGGDPGTDTRQTEQERYAELADAGLRVEAATDALVAFLGEALPQIRALTPDLYASVDGRWQEAEAQIAEARRAVAEAEQQAIELVRLRNWLDRESGVSALGHFPYDQMPAAVPQPAAA